MNNQPSLPNLFLTFLIIGSISFGGGVVAYLREYTVHNRHWINDEEFLAALAIGQTLPGLIAINLSIIIGDKKCGVVGSFLAVLGMLLPGTIIILTLWLGYLHYKDSHYVSAFLMGVAAAAVSFILKFTLELGTHQLSNFKGLLFVAITFTAVGILHIPLIIMLLTILPIAIWFFNL